MKTFRSIHYVPKIDGHFLDDGIGIWTLTVNTIRWVWKIGTMVKYYCSHLEIWTPDEHGNYEVDGKYVGTCWTSTMRGKDENGCVKRPASQVLTHPKRWFYGEWQIPDIKKFARMVFWMNDRVKENVGYCKSTIASFFWYRRTHKEVNGVKQYICSGFVNDAVAECVEKSPYKIPSPLRFTLWAVENKKRLRVRFFRLEDGKEM